MSALGDVGAGHTLGRYELLVPIAQGGMAVVWAARMKGMRGFQKLVAVKTMLPELSQDPQFEEMFLAEAGLASRIRHPHVCEILDLGEQDGLIYIVMEWIDGEPISQLARAARQKGGSVPILVALRLCLSAALGLHAAHELKDESGKLIGLVHRDVSPQNILVTYDGVVKIVDFGVAKASTEAATAATKDGQLKGKVPFMSPEQALGKKIDRRTDVFALGIVLFQLLAAKHPFRGDNDMITLRRICDKDPAPTLASVIPNCPQVVNDVVAKALEKDAANRYESMSEFARALDRAIAELKLQGLPDEDVTGFVKAVLGDRAEKRRAAIREGLKTADERAEQRQQEKAQHAAMLAQMRASGATPSNIPPPLMSIPPPPGGSSGSVPPAGDGSANSPSTSSLTNKAVIADLEAPASGAGKKKFAVVAFAVVGLAALAAAGVLMMRAPAPPPAQPVATSKPTATAATAATPPPANTQPAPAPASTETAAPAASASAAATIPKTPSTRVPPTKAPSSTPTTKTTATTTVPDNLPRVRDPGF